jgi:hypothetical protein
VEKGERGEKDYLPLVPSYILLLDIHKIALPALLINIKLLACWRELEKKVF